MLILSVKSVTKHFGPEPVLSGVTFEVRRGHRIGLVGPNGTGKTTLLRILAGREDMDAGTVETPGSAQIGYLEQQPTFHPGQTVWGEARGALGELVAMAEEAERVARAIGRASDQGEQKRLSERFDRLQQHLHDQDGYNLDHRIRRVLTGLAFSPGEFAQPVSQLSGGQQNRIILAKLLLAEPDLMLLDEPSNHLDVEATEWLESFLAASQQALIVVSHDRYFLDKVTNRTLELFRGTVDAYPGNFSAYWRQKAERLAVQRRTYQKQQVEIAKMEEFVRRHHYGQKHAQAEDRRKKLERIERVEPPREIAAPVMGFAQAARTGDVAVRVEHVCKRYDTPLVEDLSFDVLRGERWGILGPNGCGKTTLLKCLLGQEEPDSGRVILGTGVVIGYFDQLLACLDPETMVVDAVRPSHKEFPEQQRRDLLAKFGLGGDAVFQRTGSLSGGEQSRVALARLAALEANLLVLDEPTNHLDLWARDRLEKSLTTFGGTVLFVTHDRYFLNQVADHLLVVEPNGWRAIEGNYETYLHLVREGLAGQTIGDAPDTVQGDRCPNSTAKKAKGGTTPRRKRRFPYRKVADLEAEIFQREARIQQLHEALASPAVLRNGETVKAHKAEIQQQQQALATLYQHWEEATELNWN